MALNLISQLSHQIECITSVDASAVDNIEALMEGFNVSIPLIVEDAAKALSTVSIKVGSGHEVDQKTDLNTYTAFRILASPINRNVVNVKPPLFKLLVQRAGENPDVNDAIQKLAGHPEFRELRKEIAAKFEKAAGDPDVAKELAAEIDKLRVGYQRLGEKLKGISEEVRPEIAELVEMGNTVGGTRIDKHTSVRDAFDAHMAKIKKS